MIGKVSTTIKRNKLFNDTHKLLVATSGGLDSVVLLHVLIRLGYKVTIAHVNYQLRGEESDADEQFVRALGDQLQVTVLVNKFKTEDIAKQRQESIQMTARALRYQWFHSILQEQGLDYIVTGHHADDNLETAIFNMTKGTGISGLRGIPLRSERIARPLLNVSKAELMDYAQSKNLEWREDPSNAENKYNRNLIRNQVIPELRKINPSLSEHFQYTRKRLLGPEKLLMKHVERIRTQYFHQFDGERWEFDLEWLKDDEIDLVVLYEVLQEFNFSFSMVDQIFRHLEGQSGKVFMNAEFQLVTDRNRLLITKKQEDQEARQYTLWEGQNDLVFEQHHLSVETTFSIDTSSITSEAMAVLDYDKLAFPLVIRKWEAGDAFKPLGMDHQKKISDFLIDEKVSIPEKNEQYVLISGDEICWLMGRRISESFKVTSDTEKVLVLRIHSEY